MKKLPIILSIFFSPFCGMLAQQIEPFKGIDFSTGDHKLMCIQRGEIIGSKLLNEWVSSDTNLLNDLKNQLFFYSDQEEAYNSENSTNYQLTLFENDSIVYHFSAYPNSNQIAINNGDFFSFNYDWFFNTNYDLEPITPKRETFQSAESARQRYKFLSESDSVIFIYPPDWIDYNGFFQFPFYIPEDKSHSMDYYSETIRKYIIDKYKIEHFDVTIGSNNGGVYGVEIKASKELFDYLKKDKICWHVRFFEDSLYNCSFDFIYRTQNVGLTFPEIKALGESIFDEVKNEISLHYPSSTYELIYSGFGGGATDENPLYYRYTINCDEALFNSFDLFESFCFWNEYELELKYYYLK
jgi:hypothetical protein